jgi:hypothetical protein
MHTTFAIESGDSVGGRKVRPVRRVRTLRARQNRQPPLPGARARLRPDQGAAGAAAPERIWWERGWRSAPSRAQSWSGSGPGRSACSRISTHRSRWRSLRSTRARATREGSGLSALRRSFTASTTAGTSQPASCSPSSAPRSLGAFPAAKPGRIPRWLQNASPSRAGVSGLGPTRLPPVLTSVNEVESGGALRFPVAERERAEPRPRLLTLVPLLQRAAHSGGASPKSCIWTHGARYGLPSILESGTGRRIRAGGGVDRSASVRWLAIR